MSGGCRHVSSGCRHASGGCGHVRVVGVVM